MKLFLTLLVCIIFNFGYSQDTLFFTDGTSKKGKVMEINKTVVRFIPEGSDKRDRYTSDDIDSALIIIDGKEVEFEYDKVPFVGRVLLGKLISGKANLYVAEKYVFGGEDVTGFYHAGGQASLYYAKKEGDTEFFDLNYEGALVNKFNNRVSKYLKDCPDLAARIKRKELTKSDIVEIFEIYNACN